VFSRPDKNAYVEENSATDEKKHYCAIDRDAVLGTIRYFSTLFSVK